MNDIGQRIKKRREELGMSQDELARKLGYTSRTTIQKIEAGINALRQSKIEAFAQALGVTPQYLMGWDGGASDINEKNKGTDIASINEKNKGIDAADTNEQYEDTDVDNIAKAGKTAGKPEGSIVKERDKKSTEKDLSYFIEYMNSGISDILVTYNDLNTDSQKRLKAYSDKINEDFIKRIKLYAEKLKELEDMENI